MYVYYTVLLFCIFINHLYTRYIHLPFFYLTMITSTITLSPRSPLPLPTRSHLPTTVYHYSIFHSLYHIVIASNILLIYPSLLTRSRSYLSLYARLMQLLTPLNSLFFISNSL